MKYNNWVFGAFLAFVILYVLSVNYFHSNYITYTKNNFCPEIVNNITENSEELKNVKFQTIGRYFDGILVCRASQVTSISELPSLYLEISLSKDPMQNLFNEYEFRIGEYIYGISITDETGKLSEEEIKNFYLKSEEIIESLNIKVLDHWTYSAPWN